MWNFKHVLINMKYFFNNSFIYNMQDIMEYYNRDYNI